MTRTEKICGIAEAAIRAGKQSTLDQLLPEIGCTRVVHGNQSVTVWYPDDQGVEQFVVVAPYERLRTGQG